MLTFQTRPDAGGYHVVVTHIDDLDLNKAFNTSHFIKSEENLSEDELKTQIDKRLDERFSPDSKDVKNEAGVLVSLEDKRTWREYAKDNCKAAEAVNSVLDKDGKTLDVDIISGTL